LFGGIHVKLEQFAPAPLALYMGASNLHLGHGLSMVPPKTAAETRPSVFILFCDTTLSGRTTIFVAIVLTVMLLVLAVTEKELVSINGIVHFQVRYIILTCWLSMKLRD